MGYAIYSVKEIRPEDNRNRCWLERARQSGGPTIDPSKPQHSSAPRHPTRAVSGPVLSVLGTATLLARSHTSGHDQHGLVSARHLLSAIWPHDQGEGSHGGPSRRRSRPQQPAMRPNAAWFCFLFMASMLALQTRTGVRERKQNMNTSMFYMQSPSVSNKGCLQAHECVRREIA